MRARRLANLAMISALTLTSLGGTSMATITRANAATQKATSQTRADIESTMAAYNVALNGGETAAVLPLYTEDGIFMAPYSQSYVGRNAVKRAYDQVFSELKFNVKFNIAEIVQMSPRWAYVRTNSAGTTVHHSSGKTTSEANQELFILKKADDEKWKIARYSFSPTNPPKS